MQYMLIMTEPDATFEEREDPTKADAYWGAWMDYIAAMNEAGIVVNGDGLLPPHTATTVRVRDGQRTVQDGPFAEAKEQLGGYFIVEVPDLDTALDWAAKSPAAVCGAVEVRPVMPPPARGRGR
jgi:hypothetical protein